MTRRYPYPARQWHHHLLFLMMFLVVDTTCSASRSFNTVSNISSRIPIRNTHLSRRTIRNPVSIQKLTLLRGGTLEQGEEQGPPDQHDIQQQSKSMLAKFILLQNYLHEFSANLRQQVVSVTTKLPLRWATTTASLSLQPQHKQHLATFAKLYALALLGSSVGFYVFVYFITVGYALGIGLPVAVLLVETLCNKQIQMSVPTLLHSSLVLLWSLRMTLFLLWREYKAWPALHTRIQQVARNDDDERPSTIVVQVLCWTVYSFFYLAMACPVWFRLHYGASCRNGKTGIVLQLTGLALESMADWQKCRFKRQSAPTEWCHVGFWRYSTHPNYAGEFLFWLGTLLAGLPATDHVVQWILAAVGMVFLTAVLRGAVQTVDRRQEEHYGAALPEYRQFRQDYGVFGPKRWQVWKGLLLQSIVSRSKEEKEMISPAEESVAASASAAREDGPDKNDTDASDDVVVAEL